MTEITLILGGARSGKSQFAENLANNHSDKLYLATAQVRDNEMQERVEIHKNRRDNNWQTIEEPYAIAHCIKNEMKPERIILVDCLTLWLSNLMEAGHTLEAEYDDLLNIIEHPQGHIIFISNEVGLSIVPENKLAREFRDNQGILNQKLAKRADNVVFIAAGLPIYLKEAKNDR